MKSLLLLSISKNGTNKSRATQFSHRREINLRINFWFNLGIKLPGWPLISTYIERSDEQISTIERNSFCTVEGPLRHQLVHKADDGSGRRITVERTRVTRSVRGPLSALSPNANEGVSCIRAGREAVNSCALTLATCLLASLVYFILQSVNRKTLRRPARPRHRSVATSTYVSRYSPVLVSRDAARCFCAREINGFISGTHWDRSPRDERATFKNPGSGLDSFVVSFRCLSTRRALSRRLLEYFCGSRNLRGLHGLGVAIANEIFRLFR